MRRILWIGTLLLVGCESTGREAPDKPPEFILRDVPSRSDARVQGYDMLELTGHGRRCYVAAFGVSKVLLWCEEAR